MDPLPPGRRPPVGLKPTRCDAWAWTALPLLPSLSLCVLCLDLGTCLTRAYDAIAADEEAEYSSGPPPPALPADDLAWIDRLLRDKGLRT
jgi:hypothetical protein